MLCTWTRDHRVTGTGTDISTVFIPAARTRAAELAVDGRVSFAHGDASGYVSVPRSASHARYRREFLG